MKEVKQYDKQMDKLDQLGDKIVHNPSMRDLEKTLVKNEKASIIERWEGLASNTDATKNRYCTFTFCQGTIVRHIIF